MGYFLKRVSVNWSKTKWTLINTRTQATLALGARWNGWGVFLSSSERNTLGEGVFSSPVLRSRTALLFLTKAQPFQRPRQQPQQLQLAAAATSSSCHNKATNPPQQHEHTCCCKNFPTRPPGYGVLELLQRYTATNLSGVDWQQQLTIWYCSTQAM